MYPYDQIIPILKVIKRKYKDRFYYCIYDDRIETNFHSPGGQIHTFSFTYSQVLKWYDNPVGNFEKAYCGKLKKFRAGDTND